MCGDYIIQDGDGGSCCRENGVVKTVMAAMVEPNIVVLVETVMMVVV